MANAAQPGGFKRQFGGGYVHPHAANDDWHDLFGAKLQAKIIYTFHASP
jgi:hypothetical protein